MSTTTWVISDPHFGHANLIAGGRIGSRSQFTSVRQMDEAIIAGINAVVKPHHKLYVLGDITLDRRNPGLSLVNVRQLQGHKRLVPGNHDYFTAADYLAAGFERVISYREIAGMLLSHIPVHPSQFTRYKGNVHGHTHDNRVMGLDPFYAIPTPDPRYLNVCVEPLNYAPITLDQCVEHFKGLTTGRGRG